MTSLSPKIEIIYHFDKLIHKVDIDIEDTLEKYNENQYIGELNYINQIDKLDIMNNFLKTLEKQSFLQLTNLEAINLSNKRLESIEKYIFSNLKNLRTLDLSGNNLLQLGYETFNRNKNLEGFSLCI